MCHTILQIRLDAGVALEVSPDIAARGLDGNAQVLCQAEVGDAVDDAEVHGFRGAALLLRHFIKGRMEHLRRGAAMDVRSGVEGVDQILIIADLGIVRPYQYVSG